MFSLCELARGAGMCVSKERPISRNENQNKPEKKNKQQVKQNIKYLQRVYLKTTCKKSLGRLKENRKILFDVKAVLLIVPWVWVEFTIQIYLSPYFPFKIFIIILQL